VPEGTIHPLDLAEMEFDKGAIPITIIKDAKEEN
jgi:DNA-directed RNA polymerase subunit K/omega